MTRATTMLVWAWLLFFCIVRTESKKNLYFAQTALAVQCENLGDCSTPLCKINQVNYSDVFGSDRIQRGSNMEGETKVKSTEKRNVSRALSEKTDDPDKNKEKGFFYMVPATGSRGNKREILGVSLAANMTFKTGIFITESIYDMILFTKNNTFVWATYNGIFKGEMNNVSSKPTKIYDLFVTNLVHHNGLLYYSTSKDGYIAQMSLTNKRDKIWYSSGSGDRILGLTNYKDSICFLHKDIRSEKVSLRCADLPSTKAKIQCNTVLDDGQLFYGLTMTDIDENKRLFAGRFRLTIRDHGEIWIRLFAKDDMKNALCQNKHKDIPAQTVYFYNDLMYYSTEETQTVTVRTIHATTCTLGESVGIKEYPTDDGGRHRFLAVAFP